MRAYFFNNMYLSSIQQGIQAQHCTAEIFMKYVNDPRHDPNDEEVMLYNWAREHKTTIILNGADAERMDDISLHMQGSDNPYPWAAFLEPGLGDNVLTSIGIILPEKIYAGAAEIRKAHRGQYIPQVYITDWEEELCEIMNSCPLAR